MKKISSRAVAVLLVCILGISVLAGCGNSNKNDAAKKSDDSVQQSEGENVTDSDFIFGFANNNDIYPYCAKFRSYLVEEAEKIGIKVLVTDAKGDVAVQNSNIDNFIVQGAKAVGAISMDLDGSIPAVEAAKAAGIPYISFLASVRDEGNYDQYIYIGSQNYDAGLMQGQYLAEILPQDAKILYLTDRPSDQQYVDRKAGLLDGLKDRPDVEIVSEMNSENKKDKGLSITEDWLQTYDNIQCIVGQNDDSVIGAIEALKSVGKLDGVITVGLDGSDDALALIEAGEMTMSVLQDARGQAVAGAQVLQQIMDGVDPATIEDVYVPFQAVTKDNVAEYKSN